MSEKLYKVIFNGTLTGDFDEATSKSNFAKLFSIDQAKTETLFSGKDWAIKNNISKKAAMNFMITLAETGCESYFEPMVEDLDEEIEPAYPGERRDQGDRRVRYRREKLYKVIFNGTLTGDFDEATSKSNFAKLFSIEQAKTETLFSGKDRAIKNNISKKAAMNFMITLAEAGCESYFEPMVEDVDKEPAYPGERRGQGDRRVSYRREPRPRAIIPDRRLMIRRAKEKSYFATSIISGTALSMPFRAYPKSSAK